MTAFLRHRTLPRSMPQSMDGVPQRNVAILWLRHDLRVQDNVSLLQACSTAPHRLIPAFFLDPKLLQARTDVPELTSLPTMGPTRLRFYLEALQDLHRSLSARGSGLYFSLSSPAEGITSLTQQLSADASELQLFHHVYPGPARIAEEDAVADAFRESASGLPCSIHSSWGHTMHHPQDAVQALAQQRSSRKKKTKDKTTPTIELPSNSASDEMQLTRDTSLFEAIPGVMTDFRKAMEAFCHVDRPQPAPSSLPAFPEGLHSSSIPPPEDALSLYELAGAATALEGLQQLTACSDWRTGDSRRDARSAMPFSGGETAGHERLHEILHGKQQDPSSDALLSSAIPAKASSGNSGSGERTDSVTVRDERYDHSSSRTSYKGSSAETRDECTVSASAGTDTQAADGPSGSVQADTADGQGDGHALIHTFKDRRMLASGVDNSAKLSAYLAAGCLSPRQVYWQAKDAADQHGSDTGHSTLIMHLTIRDFFLYTALKEGSRLTRPEGLRDDPPPSSHSPAAFQRWARGQTGFPFVDACMRELAATGYMSNRGRQNVSSFLCKAMTQHWWLGAAVFEALLVDHDWAVNTVNWAYFAGVGNDPRDRVFRTVSQGMTYDPDAELIKSWLPELDMLSTEYAHKPWELNNDEAEKHGFDLRIYYCEPLLDPSTQIAVKHGKQKN